MNNNCNIHFLGINGSGAVGVACLAKKKGFNVSGCDLVSESSYSNQLREINIDIQVGQSEKHLNNISTLVVSPAVFFKDKYKYISEITEAMKRNIDIMRWQQFLDDYLVDDKDLIAVSGTHGKTTTTVLVANILEDCNFDPIANIGGINGRWNANYRYGNGQYFVCEADEYGNNFTFYHPKYIIINNMEMEHPEFFKNLEEYKDNFINFIKNIKQNGSIIINGDDDNIIDIILREEYFLKNKNVKVYSYSLNNKNNFIGDFINNYYVEINNNTFFFDGDEYILNNLIGEHNFRNSIITTLLMNVLGINKYDVIKSLKDCVAPKRRMEKIYKSENAIVYDDYGHHHRQIYYNLKTIRDKLNSNEKIIAILEPHLISRFRDNSKEFIEYMELADYPIITKFYKSREEDLPDLDMDYYLKFSKVKYIEDFCNVVNEVIKIKDNNDNIKFHIIVMGAGYSYKLSNKIVDVLNKC